MPADVYVVKGDHPAQMAYEAIEKSFAEDAEGKSVLLKVNAGFKGPACSGLCTHPEVVRGLIRFFKDRKAVRVCVGDSSIVGTDSMEALESAGISAVCREEGVECLDLDETGIRTVSIPNPYMVESLRFAALPFAVDFLVSVPVIKTHMYAGVTLGIKNLKGCLHKRDKTRLHRIDKPVPQPNKGRCLDYGIADLARVCYPHYTVADGFVAMEGFGPSGGRPVNLGLVVASRVAVACDMVCLALMGMEMNAIPHVNLVAEEKGFDPATIRVHPDDYIKWARRFLLASEHDLEQSYPNPKVVDRGACSACHATMIQFFRYHHQEFSDGPEMTVCMGPDLTDADISGPNVIVVGNCTGRYRTRVPFCKGCPPVPSQIVRTLSSMMTLDD